MEVVTRFLDTLRSVAVAVVAVRLVTAAVLAVRLLADALERAAVAAYRFLVTVRLEA